MKMPMTLLATASFLLAVFSALGLAGMFWMQRSTRSQQARALGIMLGHRVRPQRRYTAKRLLRMVFFSPVRLIRPLLGKRRDPKLTERLERAGLKVDTARDTYLASRLLGPLTGVLLCTFLPSNHFQWMLLSGVILYYAPDMVLKYMVKRRIERIRLGIPDVIDLLVVCVDAGLGLDQAMLRVGTELQVSHPHMCGEIIRINQEQRAGKQRIEAWRALAERLGLDEINGFVEMLLQTERFGTPIARALSSYGDLIREKRRQRAEELAAKTSVKIVFPLVLCIFPSLFIVLLGPAILTISRGFNFAGQ